jgi:hypothetical protein
MAPALLGSHAFESRCELFERQLEKADRQEFLRIVDSARVPNPRRNTKTLVGKPRSVEVAVAKPLLEASDQNRAEDLSSLVARDSFSRATAERQHRSRAFVSDSPQACLPSISSAWHEHSSELMAKAILKP